MIDTMHTAQIRVPKWGSPLVFGAELLKCSTEQIRTKSAKVGDGRTAAGARSWAPGGPSTKRTPTTDHPPPPFFSTQPVARRTRLA